MVNNVEKTMRASEIAEILQKYFRAVVTFKTTKEGILIDEISYASLSGKIHVWLLTHKPYQTVYFKEVVSGKLVLIWENGDENLTSYNRLTSENRRVYDIAIMSEETKKELHDMGLM